MQQVDQKISIGQISALLLVIYLISGHRWLVAVVILLLLGSLAELRAMDLISKVWQKGLHTIGSFNRRVLLGLVFYAFITPYAFVYRWSNRAAERRFMGKDGNSTTWDDPDAPIGSKTSFERLW
jgi:type VI protein secretion system component VasK